MYKNLGDHSILECNHTLEGRFVHEKKRNARDGKPIIYVRNQTQARELIVPDKNPIKNIGIWPNAEIKRLNQQAKWVSQKDRLALIDEAQQKKFESIANCEKRKEVLQKAQVEQRAQYGSKLETEETSAADRSLYVLQRAYELRQEQEDEVKNANSVILAAKCLAIRQQQILEKDIIKKELAEEEQRLDMMMEQERQNQIKAEEERNRIKKENTLKNSRAVTLQIHENQVQRLIEAERKEEESRNINKAMIAMQRDDAEKIRQTHIAQQKTRAELAVANANLEHFKRVQKEEERIVDFRVQEFMRKKAEREAAREAEIAKAKAKKEAEIARMQEAQLKALQAQAADDEIQALRRQEEVEREWREKQKAEALKRKQMTEHLLVARAHQMEDIRKAQAMNIEKDKTEFFRVAKVQRELYEKELEEKQKKKEAAIKHRKELLIQINEKEKNRIIKVKDKFEEGNTLRNEQEVRNTNIKNVIKKKCDKVRASHVPENFVRDIERQLKVQ